jgi:hypothetical protein
MDLVGQLNHMDDVLLKGIKTEFPDLLSNPEKAALNAYIVMSHAILEEYIEDIFTQHYERVASWVVSPQVPLETARLFFAIAESFSEKEYQSLPFKSRNTTGITALGRKLFKVVVNNNNGLKVHNIQSLAKGTGLDWQDFEADLNVSLADLNSLGGKRGEAGHLSPFSDKAVQISQNDYPDDARAWVVAGRDAVLSIASYLDSVVDAQQPRSLISDWDGN